MFYFNPYTNKYKRRPTKTRPFRTPKTYTAHPALVALGTFIGYLIGLAVGIVLFVIFLKVFPLVAKFLVPIWQKIYEALI